MHILFLKATHKQETWIPQYSRKDGTVVEGHYQHVHVTDDHDVAKVAAGGMTSSQKIAHKKVSKEHWFGGLSDEHKAAHVLRVATELQDSKSHASNIATFKSKVLAGGKPSKVEIAAYHSLPDEKKEAIRKEAVAKKLIDHFDVITKQDSSDAVNVEELKKLGREWLENSPPAKPIDRDDGLLGWVGPVGFVCQSCAGRLMGRGVDFKKLADTPIWDDEGAKSEKVCALCEKVVGKNKMEEVAKKRSEAAKEEPIEEKKDPVVLLPAKKESEKQGQADEIAKKPESEAKKGPDMAFTVHIPGEKVMSGIEKRFEVSGNRLVASQRNVGEKDFKQTNERVYETAEKASLEFRKGKRNMLDSGWVEIGGAAEDAKKEQLVEEKKEPVILLPVQKLFSKNDIPLETARRAYMGISFVPEERAEQEQEGYVKYMQSVYDDVIKIAKTDEQKKVIEAAFIEYKNGYLKKTIAHLSAKSRVMSTMITGGSNFPVHKNEKANAVEHKRLTELLEWDKWAKRKLKEAALGTRSKEDVQSADFARIRSGIASSLATIKSIDSGGDKGFDRSLFVNSIAGKLKTLAKNGEQDLVNRALDFIQEQQAGLKKPLISAKNSIWALRAEVPKGQEIPTGVEVIGTADGVEIVNNKDDERVQIVFDEKPDPDVIKKLKSSGFKWSPTRGVWQRQNTANGIAAAKGFLNTLNG